MDFEPELWIRAWLVSSFRGVGLQRELEELLRALLLRQVTAFSRQSLERAPRGPGTGIELGVLDGDDVLEGVRAHEPETLGHFHVRRLRQPRGVEPLTAVETSCFNDEHITVPVTRKMSFPPRIRILQLERSVEINVTDEMTMLVEHRDL